MSRRPDSALLSKLREAHDPAHPFMVIAISPPLVYSKDPVEEILSILSGIAGVIEERENQDAYDTVMFDADGHSFGMVWYDAGDKGASLAPAPAPLKRSEATKTSEPWSPADQDYVAEHYGDLTVKVDEIARHVGRTKNAVIGWANAHGLKRRLRR